LLRRGRCGCGSLGDDDDDDDDDDVLLRLREVMMDCVECVVFFRKIMLKREAVRVVIDLVC